MDGPESPTTQPTEPRHRGLLRRARDGDLGRSTAWMLASQLGQTATQAVYFVLIARALGAGSYGVFVAAAGLAAAVGPFGTFGMAMIVMRDAARAPEHVRVYWGNALVVTLAFGTVLAAIFTAAAGLLLPAQSSLALIACVAAADLLFANLHYVNSQTFLGMKLARRSAQMPLLLNVMRLAVAGTFMAAGGASPTTWAMLYAGSSAAAAVTGTIIAARSFGRPSFDVTIARREVRAGAVYAFGFSTTAVYNDIDKPLVARWASVEAAGAYAAGYRVVNIALAPVRSLLFVAMSRFFQHGVNGVTATAAYARKLAPTAAGFGVLAGVALYLAAPLAPVFFGAGFEDASDTMRLLAVMPLLKAVQNLGGDALTGADHHLTRSIIQLVVTVVNIALNAWWIPLYSYRGAIGATLVCDVVLLVLLWSTLGYYVARARTRLREAGPPEAPVTP